MTKPRDEGNGTELQLGWKGWGLWLRGPRTIEVVLFLTTLMLFLWIVHADATADRHDHRLLKRSADRSFCVHIAPKTLDLDSVRSFVRECVRQVEVEDEETS